MPQNIRLVIARRDGGQVRLPSFTTTTDGKQVVLNLTTPDDFVIQAEFSHSPTIGPSTDGDGRKTTKGGQRK